MIFYLSVCAGNDNQERPSIYIFIYQERPSIYVFMFCLYSNRNKVVLVSQ